MSNGIPCMVQKRNHKHPVQAWFWIAALSLSITGCAVLDRTVSLLHLAAPAATPPADKIPDFAAQPPLPAPPIPTPRPETYSVVVHNIGAQELLFALARDARLNIDIHPGINGTVTMNVLDQTLTEILDRIAGQIDMRYELGAGGLTIMPDSPYLKVYRIDYPNIQRNA